MMCYPSGYPIVLRGAANLWATYPFPGWDVLTLPCVKAGP